MVIYYLYLKRLKLFEIIQKKSKIEEKLLKRREKGCLKGYTEVIGIGFEKLSHQNKNLNMATLISVFLCQ